MIAQAVFGMIAFCVFVAAIVTAAVLAVLLLTARAGVVRLALGAATVGASLFVRSWLGLSAHAEVAGAEVVTVIALAGAVALIAFAVRDQRGARILHERDLAGRAQRATVTPAAAPPPYPLVAIPVRTVVIGEVVSERPASLPEVTSRGQ